MGQLARIRKAIVGAVSTGSGVYGALLVSGAKVDPLVELGAAIIAGIIGGAIVWATPNAPPA